MKTPKMEMKVYYNQIERKKKKAKRLYCQKV